MEIPKGSTVGFNQSVYKLEKPVRARKHNTCKIIILEDVSARCVSTSTMKNKNQVTTFSKGTLFNYTPVK